MVGGELEELRFGVSSGTDTDDAEDGGGDGTRVYEPVELGVSALSAPIRPPGGPATEEDGAFVGAFVIPPILVNAIPEGNGGNITSPGCGCGCDKQLS